MSSIAALQALQLGAVDAARVLMNVEATMHVAAVTPGAWSIVPYGLRGDVRFVWNASPYLPPSAIQLCDRGFVWVRRETGAYRAELYVPRPGEPLLMYDGGRLVVVKADATLAGIYAEIHARGELGRIVLAPQSARRIP